jgi:hypothetical protein
MGILGERIGEKWIICGGKWESGLPEMLIVHKTEVELEQVNILIVF